MLYLRTVSYSLCVAQKFGVNCAVMLSFIDNSLANGITALSRDDIFNNTGVDADKQKEVEEVLTECGVLTVTRFSNRADKNYYKIEEQRLVSALSEKSLAEIVLGDSAKVTESEKTSAKRITQKSQLVEKLKRSIKTSDPIVRQYMCDWIDAVHASPKGYLSVQGVTISEQELSAYSASQEVQIAILKIAIVNSYRDLTWAIQRYEKDHSATGNNFVKYSDIKSDGSDSSDEVF